MVSGTAGVGKTALALRWAQRARPSFPDGQLYVDLRGYDHEQPLSAGDALARFLRALGRSGLDIPHELDERAAAYRSILAGRRMLVVLDNASTVEQVYPLLPGESTCRVVVTSRDSLPGLVARHGARRLELDLLPMSDAVALLRSLVGERVSTDLAAANELVKRCAGLPLALRVAAELAVARADTSIAELAADLQDEQHRLDMLDAGGDVRTAVRGVFSWSYRHLTADQARSFQLIGLSPGPDIDTFAAAACIGSDVGQARRVLNQLARTHLVTLAGADRFGMHDLLRAYATELAGVENSAEERTGALTRLFDHYLATSAAAMDILVPSEKSYRPHVAGPGAPGPAVNNIRDATDWLDKERVNLVASCVYAAAHGLPGYATQLAATLFRYFDFGGHYVDALTAHSHALHAARSVGDLAAEAEALTNLGGVHWRQGRHRQALDYLDRALPIALDSRDCIREAVTLTHLGIVHWHLSNYAEAAGYLQRGFHLFDELKERTGAAISLSCLGLVLWRQGRFVDAADHGQRALVLFTEVGDRFGAARVLANLGVLAWRCGEHQQAVAHLHQALDLCKDSHQACTACALTYLGLVHGRQGRADVASEHHQRALVIATEIGDRNVQAITLTNLGTTLFEQGKYDAAIEHHEQAVDLFRELGDRAGEAEALNGVGHALCVIDPSRARPFLVAALALATEIGERYQQARAHHGLAGTHPAETAEFRLHRRRACDLYAELGLEIEAAESDPS
ncbi:MAG: ATP-binding protein [Pseudonocardia sp.]